MTQLQVFKEMPITEAYAAIERNKTNPSVMIRSFLELTESIHGGEVLFVDATNPTVLGMEMTGVGISAALREDKLSLRRTYSSLAETPDDLSDHMSDWDFANMFASPSTEPFLIFIDLKSFLLNAVRDEGEKCRKIIIPRDTYIHKDGHIFTMHYPIVMRLFDVGNLEISYDASIISNFQSLETNIIPNYIVKTPDDNQFITFTIPVMQVEITRYNDTTSAGQFFERSYAIKNQFYYARAWYRNTSTGNEWKEMRITHGRLNYDQRFPTMLLTIEGDVLICRLPQVYMVNNRLLGEIAVDIYSTFGNMNERMPDDRYEINFRSLDATKNNKYTPQALSSIPRWASPEGILTGGKDGLTFEQVRERVIHNATGPQEIPISPVQIRARIENAGFTVDKNVDMVTERIFYASRKLPSPTNKRLITAANIGIHTFITEQKDLVNHPFVYSNGNRWTLSPKNLYEHNNGMIRLLPTEEITFIRQMEVSARITHLNTHQFLYTPFHYVYDVNNLEFDLRAYYLDKPKPGLINFVRTNSTLQLVVNTSQREIVRTEYGYQLRIKMLSGNHFKAIPDGQIGVQLRFTPYSDPTPVFIRGYILSMVGGERVFAFDLKTNYDLNEDNAIFIQGVGVNGNENQNAWLNLETEFHIFVCTNNLTNNYSPDESIDEFGPWQFDPGWVPITHEKINITLGYALKNLWRRARNQKSNYPFEYYDTDVPAHYVNDVYEVDPITGLIWTIDPLTNLPVRSIKHPKGDPIIDPVTLEPILLFKKGDVVFEAGLPKETSTLKQPKEADILFIDGRHYFVTDSAYIDYNQELVDILVDWITESLEDIQKRALEKTKVYLHPRSQIGSVQIEYGDGKVKTIPSEQSPRIDLYLSDAVFSDDVMRETIKLTTVRVLDEALSGVTLNNSEVTDILRDAYGATVASFRLHGFGPDRDIYYANVTQNDRSLSLKRLIEAQGDGALIMREDVTFNYYRAKMSQNDFTVM